MPNPNHLALIERGVEAWNAARRVMPDEFPELSGADLSQRQFAGIDFRDADLRDASLRGCDLQGADFSDAWLEGADFTGARLIGARVSGARVTRWRIDGAVLADPSQHLGDGEQLTVLLRGATVWDAWRQENRDVSLDLPEDAWLAKIVRTQVALAEAVARTRFEGDETHLAMLREGVDRWNAWRTENPDVRPDLSRANLSGASLHGANLSEANLSGVILAGADVRFARLDGSNLCEAFLCWADLSGASLIVAGLVRANLTGVDLTQAVLHGAHCEEANMTGARLNRATNLDEARLDEADFFEGNARQLALLYGNAADWNAWREQKPEIVPDLRGANLVGFRFWGDPDLRRANLARAHLTRANGFQVRLAEANLRSATLIGSELNSVDLSDAKLEFAVLSQANLAMARLAGASLVGADLSGVDLGSANLAGATLSDARLPEADLAAADLSGASLVRALLLRANLSRATLTNADLTEANLTQATLVETKVDGTTLAGAYVYGVSAWGLDLSRVRDQTSLRITKEGRAGLTVDNLELAQFVYLMAHNEKIRGVIDTIGRKAVLILGRFYDERKAVLDALKTKLREFDLVPIVFDWDKPESRDLTETVALLANMSRFVVADVTDAKSIPQELAEIVPRLPSVPVQPILLRGDPGYAMFEHWKGYRTMLSVFEYRDQADLLDHVEQAILAPVTAWEAGTKNQASLDDELRAKDAEIERLRAILRSQPS